MLPPYFSAYLLHIYIHVDKLRKACDCNVQRYAIVSSRRGSVAAAATPATPASSTPTPTTTSSPSSAGITAATSNRRGDCKERDNRHECSTIPPTKS